MGGLACAGWWELGVLLKDVYSGPDKGNGRAPRGNGGMGRRVEGADFLLVSSSPSFRFNSADMSTSGSFFLCNATTASGARPALAVLSSLPFVRLLEADGAAASVGSGAAACGGKVPRRLAGAPDDMVTGPGPHQCRVELCTNQVPRVPRSVAPALPGFPGLCVRQESSGHRATCVPICGGWPRVVAASSHLFSFLLTFSNRLQFLEGTHRCNKHFLGLLQWPQYRNFYGLFATYQRRWDPLRTIWVRLRLYPWHTYTRQWPHTRAAYGAAKATNEITGMAQAVRALWLSTALGDL